MPATLKHDDLFALFNEAGDTRDATHGLYWRDTRHLSRFTLAIDGQPPTTTSSGVTEDNVVFRAGLAVGGDVHLRRRRFLRNATSYERLVVDQLGDAPRNLILRIDFAADFADLFEVRGATRARRGTTAPPVVGGDHVTFTYDGLDGVRRTTRLRFDPVPDHIDAGHCVFDLPSRRRSGIMIEIACDPTSTIESLPGNWTSALRARRRQMARGVPIATSDPILDAVLRRSLSDLRMLTVATPHGRYPHAGLPWFSTAFGRDALITALLMLKHDPDLARGVLVFLAAEQATADDAANDAEPGKIVHEMRQGEMAALGEVPFRRYFGSVDATPLFVVLAGAWLEATDDSATIATLWPAIEAAMGWIDCHGDGFVTYARRTAAGLVNQGWKDSDDCVFHADGRLASGPIALCEVQAYVHAARRAAAAIAARLGHRDRARRLDEQADTLRRRFDQAFWCDDIGTFALALDGDNRPCRVRASNAGHALFAGIALPERAATLAATLMAPTSFSGWGVRTLATSEARYDPRSYHNGSVWPHDSALVALGLARYGFEGHARRIARGLLDAATFTDRRLPELLCGLPRERDGGPVPYPVACSPQAWAAAALPGLLHLLK